MKPMLKICGCACTLIATLAAVNYVSRLRRAEAVYLHFGPQLSWEDAREIVVYDIDRMPTFQSMSLLGVYVVLNARRGSTGTQPQAKSQTA